MIYAVGCSEVSHHLCRSRSGDSEWQPRTPTNYGDKSWLWERPSGKSPPGQSRTNLFQQQYAALMIYRTNHYDRAICRYAGAGWPQAEWQTLLRDLELSDSGSEILKAV